MSSSYIRNSANLYFSIIDVKQMFIEIDSRRLGVNNTARFVPSEFLHPNRLIKINKQCIVSMSLMHSILFKEVTILTLNVRFF